MEAKLESLQSLFLREHARVLREEQGEEDLVEEEPRRSRGLPEPVDPNEHFLRPLEKKPASAQKEWQPPALARLLLQFAPLIRAIMMVLSVVAPIYLKAFQLLHAIIKVMPWDLVQALVGLGLCFFGGKYCASIAAAEAFYLTGWARTRGALGQIYTEIVLVVDANEKDD